MSKHIGTLERVANAAGHIYRYQLTQLPRRKALLKECWQKELKPPTLEDWPDTLVRTCVAIEVIFWFFLGEAIGRGSLSGYIVPATYVDKKLAKLAKQHKDKTYDVAPDV